MHWSPERQGLKCKNFVGKDDNVLGNIAALMKDLHAIHLQGNMSAAMEYQVLMLFRTYKENVVSSLVTHLVLRENVKPLTSPNA